MNPDDIQAAFNRIDTQMQQIQSALAQLHARLVELRKMLDKKNMPNSGGGGIINAIRRRHMKHIAPNNNLSIQATGMLQHWSRAKKD